MNPTEQLAHFSGGTNDLSMTGLWYSHKRVAQLVEAARQECRDREATEADVRARLADAEKANQQLRRDIAGQTRSASNGWRNAEKARGELNMLRSKVEALTEGLCECGDESCMESAWLIALNDALGSKP